MMLGKECHRTLAKGPVAVDVSRALAPYDIIDVLIRVQTNERIYYFIDICLYIS